jgi:hypothetical protein
MKWHVPNATNGRQRYNIWTPICSGFLQVNWTFICSQLVNYLYCYGGTLNSYYNLAVKVQADPIWRTSYWILVWCQLNRSLKPITSLLVKVKRAHNDRKNLARTILMSMWSRQVLPMSTYITRYETRTRPGSSFEAQALLEQLGFRYGRSS